MADLEGKTIAATYESLLNVGTADNQNLDTTPRVIADGVGTASALYLATDEVLINSTNQLTFNATGSGEYIYGDGTDLRIYSGADILLMSTGKVGIGTAVPSTTLQIGDISGGAESTFFMTDSDRGFKITVGSGTNATLQSTGTTVPLIFQAGTGNDGDYHFTSSGKVGIGTVTPAAKMHIVSSYDTLAWTLGYGMHRHSFDRDIRYAHNADQTVIVQATIGLYIPDGALITLVSAVVKTVTDLGTHKVNITGSSYSGSAADAAVGGTATELLGAGAAGTQSTDSGSATDIDLTQANEVWVNNTINRGGVANNQYIYVLNAGSANGTTDSTAGTLSIAIEWFGID